MRPGGQGAPAELRAVIGAQHLRQPSARRELLQHPRDMTSPERPRGHNRHRLGRGIVHDRQAFQDSAFGRAIEDEVRRPDLIAVLRARQRLTVLQRDLFPAPALLLAGALRRTADRPAWAARSPTSTCVMPPEADFSPA